MKTFHSFRMQLLLFTVFALLKTAAIGQLQAGFTADTRSSCPPFLVNFKDSSSGNPTSWQWDLGNGAVSSKQNPSNTYFTSGSYDIKLTVTSEDGTSSTITRSKYIVVNALPVANFGASKTKGCYPLAVQFSDSSLAGSGTVSAWKWDFGDGTLSDAKNPLHTYTGAGSYTVVLRVTNSAGCTKVLSRTAYINIQNGVKAGFSYTSPAGCSTPTTVNFTNETVGTGVLKYLWDFGNGKTSTDKNPANSYQNAGVYTVKLTATNSLGCADTLTKSNAINIGFVKADFKVPDAICAGANVRLTNTSAPATYVKSRWTFGDGTFSDSANPFKTYIASGTFQVKLVTDFGSCRDSISKPVTVLPQPVPSFTAANNVNCKAPLNVTFTNTTTGGVSFLWNFGDGTTSTLENPAHNYTKAQNFTVTLTVKNASGCSGTLIKPDFVRNTAPKITSIKNLPFKGCIPSIVSPAVVINGNVAGSAFLWNFGDGTTSTDSLPSHTYPVSGNYNVKLTFTTPEGCSDSVTIVNGVQVGIKPKADFSGDPLDVCAMVPVTFTDLSSGATANNWLWNFGDNTVSALQNPAHAYSSTGKFSVTLIVFNFGCSDTLKKTNYVYVRPPIAKFDTAFFCNDPLKRVFINKSIEAKTWEWNFGDGTSSTDSAVSHIYAAPGVYPVSLKVTNGACEHTIKKDVVLIKERGNIETGITESCINTRILFNVANVTAANISSYAWYFNGFPQPAVITTVNPFGAVYSAAGVKYPSVIMTNKLNCKDTLYAAVPVTTYGSKAAFGSPNPRTCLGSTVNFTDSTKTDGTHPVTSWTWNYGDGVTQVYTSSSFTHSYSAAGNFTVKLLVKDSYGCADSVTKPLFISVTKPVAGFKVSDTVICPRSPVTFTNTSKSEGGSYLWQFGDSTTSVDISPVHAFSKAGSYTVVLRVTDKNGCTDSASAKIEIFTAQAAFALSDSFSKCPPLIVNMTNQSAKFTKLNWDFGDSNNSQLLNPSHIYTYPGVYNVKLTIYNNGGCTDTLTRQITIEGPTGIFYYSPKEACEFGAVNFSLQSNNTTSYIWDFNDGTTIHTTNPAQSHIYTTAGTYTPKIILEDTSGCKVPLSGLDTIKINGIKANISSDVRLLCDSGIVIFEDSTTSNDIVTGWQWNFGDNTSSVAQSPTHKFDKPGFYTISLISTSKFGCKDTAVGLKYIKVVSSPEVKITGDSSACEPAQLNFQGEFVKTDTAAVTWKWDFGNGKTSDLIKPETQTFTTAGSYTVTVKATNSDGCYDSVSRKAVIYPKPAVDAGPDTTICRFTTYKLPVTGADIYTWNADRTLSCLNCAAPVATPDSTATYYVTGKTGPGCTNKDSVTVKVQQPFKMEVSKDDTLCRGETITLKATGTDRYIWTPSLWLDNAKTGTPKSTPDSAITYKVTGTDSLNCFKAEGSVRLKVYPKPVIEITNGENIIVQAGNKIKLLTKNSPDIISWKWSPATWLSCTSCAEPVTTPKNNITYTVTAANQGLCATSDNITVNLICNNANVYIPNTFSPNNDGANDVFYVRGTGVYSIRSLKIFNRWGQLVYSKNEVNANDPQYGWDGTLNGTLLQADVYVYMAEVICSNNITIPLKGNVTLVR